MTISDEYVKALNDKFVYDNYVFTLEQGRKFDKVMITNTEWSGRSVHAFILKADALLIKPATYKAPQKSIKHKTGLAVRYDLSTFEGFTEALNASDVYGGYLYER